MNSLNRSCSLQMNYESVMNLSDGFTESHEPLDECSGSVMNSLDEFFESVINPSDEFTES